MSKSFFDDKLDLGLTFFTPYDGKIYQNQYSEGPNFTQRMNVVIPVRQISLSITWNFGNTKKQYQQHQSKINNDFQEKKNDSQMGVGGVGM